MKRKVDDRIEENEEERSTKRTFKAPQSSDKISELSNKIFAEQSKKKIEWAVKMYNEWRCNRMKQLFVESQIRRSDVNEINELSKDDLCFALTRFIREIKKVDNSDFPPNSLREIVIMIQMHLHQQGLYWRLLDDEWFTQLRNVLDNTMKERHAMGLG